MARACFQIEEVETAELEATATPDGPDLLAQEAVLQPKTAPRPPAGNGCVRKIPSHLRRRRPDLSAEGSLVRRAVLSLKSDSQAARTTLQAAFALLCLWVGYEFYQFMQWGQSAGSVPYPGRPPGAEGFLPISALLSLKYWLNTGILNDIHPSGLFILLAILAVGLLLKKGFCSWMCPVGTLSESLWMFGRKIFKRNLKINRWLDYPLRSLKYLLLLFFVQAIWNMDVPALEAFIYSPYNKVADAKMYLFFADITPFALWTIVVLAALSVVIQNFWCRYLCPYGALLGALSWLSPLKVTRDASTCVDCRLCTRACPASIKVHEAGRVWSDECTGCYSCIESCPIKDTLVMGTGHGARPVPGWKFGALAAGIFVLVTGLAMVTGNWHNGISRQEYLMRFQEIDSPVYSHPGR